MRKLNLAIVGASGLVGKTAIKILCEENLIELFNLTLYVSSKSVGKTIMVNGFAEKLIMLDKKAKQKHFDIVIMSAGDDISKEYAPFFAQNGAYVIDNTNAFRRDKDVPLIVPEININKISRHTKIIANPNCSTIQLAVVLDKLESLSAIKKVVVSTYQSVSGAGVDALLDLKNHTRNIIEEGISNNVVAHIGDFLPYGFCTEEDKMMFEIKKILSKDIPLCATTVRVPVEHCHAESVFVEFETEVDAKEAEKTLACNYIKVDTNNVFIPTNCFESNLTFVCRTRSFSKTELSLFIVADNLRRGAAYNAVSIARYITQNFILKK